MMSQDHQQAAPANSRGETFGLDATKQDEKLALLASPPAANLEELSATTTSTSTTTYGTALANADLDASQDELDGAKLVWWQHLLLAQAFSHTVGRAE